MGARQNSLSISGGILLLATSILWLALTVAVFYVAWQTPPLMSHHRWLAVAAAIMMLVGVTGATTAVRDLGRRDKKRA